MDKKPVVMTADRRDQAIDPSSGVRSVMNEVPDVKYDVYRISGFLLLLTACCVCVQAAEPVPRAFVDGAGPGWVALGEDDFAAVNSADDTWAFSENLIQCTGQPVSVMRTRKQYTNFELVCEWRHLKDAGNSGIFVWTIPESLERLQGPGLPHGIEVQVLDLGYKTRYEKNGQRKADWFTCHGDVFPVGESTMKPFPPVAPNGKRSFPSKELSRGVGQWNHYYVRAINGEVRLWVNGEEVSGGTECSPAVGYLCLESEGSPVEFRGLKIRELP